ncbi:MAG: arginase family protein [bacterium]|nr:arginase family protein [bacterium]
MKFVYANSDLKGAEFVLIGVPDESGSHSSRKGAKKGPDAIRKVATERCVFKRNGKISLAQVSSGKIQKKIYDYGNIPKKKISQIIRTNQGRIPIIIGGDHSITTEVLSCFPHAAVIYFDAHPDIISSEKRYYGSVLHDAPVDLKKSILVGMREPETEELATLKKVGLQVISPQDFYEHGLPWVWKQIAQKTKGKKVYISLDLDVFDPSIAPGVSTPVPGGLDFNQVLFLMKRIMKQRQVIGFDIMELNPSYDQDQRTAHLAVKLLLEMIANST